MRRAALLLAVLLGGCTLPPTYYTTLKDEPLSLRKGDLETAGIAFVTPSTVTTQEEEKQAVALAFADVLKRERPQLRVSTLAETLSAVNRAGLAEPYRRMYEDYRNTGLFPADTLKRLSAATGARYIAQLKLQGFAQGSKNRFGVLGLRVMETQYADLRLFFQIWDASDAALAWEGMEEVRITVDSTSERPITARELLERSASDLVARLP